LFTQHVLFILWRDTTSELWTLVLFPSYCYHLFTLLTLFTLLAHLLFSTRYTHNLCFKQTDEIDNLIASWEQSTWLCVCRFRIVVSKQSLDEAPYINCPKLSQTSKHHLQSFVSPLQERLNLGFLTKGKSCCCTHHTFLLGFPTGWTFN
jgi:hypothetical protein